jgi:hypothetical protein
MQRLSNRSHVGNFGTGQKQTLFGSGVADSGRVFVKKRADGAHVVLSDQRVPMPYVAGLSSMIMIFGGDEEVIERARTRWEGAFVPKRTESS